MNGTYTQRRRRQMAGGGITSLQNRPGYFLGGVGDFFGGIKDKIVDDLIPNEIKDSPVGTALVGGALLNQFGLPSIPGLDTKGMGQNWLGNLLGGVMPGDTQFNTVLGDTLPFMFQDTTTNPLPGGLDQLYKDVLAQDMSGIMGDGRSQALQKIAGILPDVAGKTTGTLKQYQDYLRNQAAQETVKRITGADSPDVTPDASGRYPIRWKEPLAIGTTIGLADYLTRSDDKMPAQLAIDPSRFATAEAAMADPNLRFKPETQYALAADGGRIGYDDGKSVINYNEDPEYRGWKKMYEQNPDVASMHDNHDTYLNFYNAQGQAQGGRIGYRGGKGVASLQAGAPDIKYEGDMRMASHEGNDAFLEQRYEYYLDLGWSPRRAAEQAQKDLMEGNFDPGPYAKGGRVAAQEGGLMDLGGMEKDYRQEGGFVPIGGQEKADDVPARLSKNEFVFTADAVRNAGGGDIDAGAEVMENLMNHLEAGGKVSEDSQGLEGAQEMFANTQRLQNRII